MAVDDWLAAGPENKRAFHQLLELWSKAGDQGAYAAPDLQQEWQRWEAGRQAGKTGLRPVLTKRWAAAAIVLLVLGAGLLFLLRPHPPTVTAPMLVITAGDSILYDTLADRSSIVLSSGSRLQRPAVFEGTARTVQLEGEAYFAITPDEQKPFIVHTPLADIKVIGTAFNVHAGKDSVVVQVDNGAVLLYNQNDSVAVKGGMQGLYLASDRSFHVTKIEDANNYAYATRVFRFQETRLETVAKTLEKAYNIKIVLENKKLANCTINTAFADMPLTYVLEVISASLAIQYRVDGTTIYLQGNECN
jgi:ferric-dicitrate binding protein FerR (iron transport regulator)